MALIQYLTQIEFDYGALAQIQAHCQRAGITRALMSVLHEGATVDAALAQLEGADA